MLTLRSAVPALALALSIPAHATSVINVGPLASAEAVTIEEVLVGSTLGLRGDKPSTELFGQDFARSARFKSAMATALKNRFTEAGIPVSPTAKHSVQVALFGGTVASASCGPKVFYLVVVTVSQPDDTRGYPERTILGVSEDSTLEAAVIDAAIGAVDEFIAQRAASRKVAR